MVSDDNEESSLYLNHGAPNAGPHCMPPSRAMEHEGTGIEPAGSGDRRALCLCPHAPSLWTAAYSVVQHLARHGSRTGSIPLTRHEHSADPTSARGCGCRAGRHPQRTADRLGGAQVADAIATELTVAARRCRPETAPRY